MGHIVTQIFLSATDFLFYLIHGEHVTYCSINENWKKEEKTDAEPLLYSLSLCFKCVVWRIWA